MLDTFSKDIVYKELPPPYTPTLFIELIRFIPGQPDTVLANGGASHPSSSTPHTSSHQAFNGNPYTQRALPHPTPRATPHSFSSPHPTIAPGAHMPPPPPWEVKWRRPVPASASATTATPQPAPPPVSAISVPSPSAASSSSVRRHSTSSSVTPLAAPAVLPGSDDKRLPSAVVPMTPPSASRKRKYPEGDASVSGASPYGSPAAKRLTPPPPPAPLSVPPPPPPATASSSSSSSPTPASSHRATQTLSPSLAMIMSPDSRHAPPFVGSSSASLPATPPQQRKVKLTCTNGEGTPR